MASSDEESILDKKSPEQVIMEAGARVLQAGIWLIRNGYGRMLLLPYASPSGAYWRCEFHPMGRPSRTIFRYTSGSEARYLENHCGGSIRSNVSPEKLAQAIMKSVPDDIKSSCEGPASPEMLSWLVLLEAAVDGGFLAEAFHDYTEDYSRWELVSLIRGNGDPIPAPPGYVRPGDERCIVDLEWRDGEAAWNAVASDAELLIGLETLSDDERCYELADRLRRGFAETTDGFEATRLLRAAIGTLSTLE